MVETFVCSLCHKTVSVQAGNVNTGCCDVCFNINYSAMERDLKYDYYLIKQNLNFEYEGRIVNLLGIKDAHYRRADILATAKSMWP